MNPLGAPSATVIVPTITPERAIRLLDSLDVGDGAFETWLIDNGTGSELLRRAAEAHDGVELMQLDENVGYSRAVNLAARRAQGDVLVLLNDDSLVDPGYVERVSAPIDLAAGAVMVAGVMRDAARPELIETAGIEVDRTLLAYDYLNGEPTNVLERDVADPIGPSGAAAAFAREAFLEAGGFDEALFAYLEDLDLVLRLRLAGASCRLAKDARGSHEHSGTLGPGSARKDYLVGYGRGYLLRKWSVITPGRLPGLIARELIVAVGQVVVDRNLGALRGRRDGLRAAGERRTFPADALRDPPSLSEVLVRRWRRRARLRRRD